MMLLNATGFDVAWAVGLKFTHRFSRLRPSIGTLIAMAVSMYVLARASTGLPIGTAYAVWTGIGAVGTTVVAMLLLNESRDRARTICINWIILGVIGLKAFPEERSAANSA